MQMSFKRIMYFSVMTAAVVSLPGCFNFGGSSSSSSSTSDASSSAASSGQALVSYNGKALITKEQFDEKLSQLLKANAYTRSMKPEEFPVDAKKRMLNDWATVSVIREGWGRKADVESNPEFKEKLQAQVENFKDVLTTDLFVKEVKETLKADDAELERDAKADYDKNKSKYVKVLGGVRVTGVSFASKEKAQPFYDKVRTTVADFEKLAEKEASGKLRDFGRVSQEERGGAPQPRIPAQIRQAALSTNKVPRVDLVTADNETWVLHISDKKDTVYFGFDEIKNELKGMMENNKLNETLQKKVEELKKAGNMTIHEELLGSPTAAANPMADVVAPAQDGAMPTPDVEPAV